MGSQYCLGLGESEFFIGTEDDNMSDTLNVKWPWTMVEFSFIDEIISQIMDSLPSNHQLQTHTIFPGIKWDGRPIFLVDDETTGEYLLMNFEVMTRCKMSKLRIPKITVLKSTEEVRSMIEQDHLTESAKFISEEPHVSNKQETK